MIVRNSEDSRITVLQLSRAEVAGLTDALGQWAIWEDGDNFGEGYPSEEDAVSAALVHKMLVQLVNE